MGEAKKIKVKVRKKKINFKRIILALVIIYFLYFLISSLLKMPIQNIYIVGNSYVSDKEIIESASLKNYPSYLLTFSSTIKKDLLENPYIKNVSIKKNKWRSVTIEIEENHLLCIDKLTGKIILENGNKENNTYDILDIPVLVNEVTESYFEKFVSSFSEVESDVLHQISEIEYSPSNVDEKRFILYMNDGNHVYITLDKIEKLNEYNKIKNDLNGKKGTLYLDSGNYFEIRK